jgi:hypothetical protein
MKKYISRYSLSQMISTVALFAMSFMFIMSAQSAYALAGYQDWGTKTYMSFSSECKARTIGPETRKEGGKTYQVTNKYVIDSKNVARCTVHHYYRKVLVNTPAQPAAAAATTAKSAPAKPQSTVVCTPKKLSVKQDGSLSPVTGFVTEYSFSCKGAGLISDAVKKSAKKNGLTLRPDAMKSVLTWVKQGGKTDQRAWRKSTPAETKSALQAKHKNWKIGNWDEKVKSFKWCSNEYVGANDSSNASGLDKIRNIKYTVTPRNTGLGDSGYKMEILDFTPSDEEFSRKKVLDSYCGSTPNAKDGVAAKKAAAANSAAKKKSKTAIVNGAEVRAFQSKWNTYKPCGSKSLPVNGTYNASTKKALVTATGVSKPTQGDLGNYNAKVLPPRNCGLPVKPAMTVRYRTTSTGGIVVIGNTSAAKAKKAAVKTGDRGSRVKSIQRALNSKGAKLKVDGIFGSGTKAAILKFQKNNGLKATGSADSATMAKLGL